MQLSRSGKKSGYPYRMTRNLATSLLLYEQIKTTCPKARATQKMVEKWLTLACDKSLSARRKILSQIYDKMAYCKLMDVIAPKIKAGSSGKTRIYKLNPRKGDGALTCLLTLDPKLQVKSKESPEFAKKRKKIKEVNSKHAN